MQGNKPTLTNELLNRISPKRKTQRRAKNCLVLYLPVRKKMCERMQQILMSQHIWKCQTELRLAPEIKTNHVVFQPKYSFINLPLIPARLCVIVSAVLASSSDLTPVCAVTSRHHHYYHQLPRWLYSPQSSVQPRTLPNLLPLTNANTSSYIAVVVTRRNGEVSQRVNRHKVQNKPFKLPKEL